MKKYNIIVGVFIVISVIYLFNLKKFSLDLLERRASGVTDIELLINYPQKLLFYAVFALVIIIIAVIIAYKIIKQVHCSDIFNDYINAFAICVVLILIIVFTINFITIPIMQILLSGVAIVGGIAALVGGDS